MMWGYGFNWVGMFLMMLVVVILIVLLVVLVWMSIRRSRKRTSFPASGPTALEILRQRYARGDIDTTTFEQMHERLEVSINHEPVKG